MAKVVRYLDENGSWQFATVHDIGEMSQLLTTHKDSVVGAINELQGQGSAKEIQEIINGDISNLNSKYQGIVKDVLLKADLETVNGQLSKKVDITEYLEEYNEIFNALKDKVNVSEYVATYEDVVSKLNDKVDNLDFHKLEGKFSNMETEIINLDDEISQRLRKSEFDDAVGVNKWVVTKYRVTDDSIDVKEILPNFDLLARSKSLEVRELADKTDMAFYKEARTITHYFTNVFVDVDKEVIVDVTYSDAFAMYMNSAMIYQNKSNNKATVSISMSLRSGWNTIEMILGTSNIFPTLDIVNNISTSVDKMTTTIGVGDKNESRLINTETIIKQTSDEILLKADKLEVENIGNKVTNNEASIKLANDKIALKVEKEEFDNYSKRLETAESSLEVQSDSIKAKVEQTDFNLLNEKVNSNTSSVEVLEGAIELKVSKEEYDGLKEQVSSAETSISLNTESIKLKAEKTELDGVDERLKNTQTSLEVAIGSIESKVSKSEYDTKVSEMVNAIKDAMEEAKTANDKLLELSDDDKLSPSEKQSTKMEWSSIEAEFPLIMSQANNYGLTVDDKKLYNDKFNDLKSYIEPIISNMNTITEISGTEFRRYFTEYYQARTSVQTIILEKAKALSDKAMDKAEAIGEEVVHLGGRVNATETSITQTAEEIKSKADKSTVYTISDIDEKLGTIDLDIKNANTEISQTAEKISQKANSSDVYTKIESDDFLEAKAGVDSLNALVTRVETAESELVQTSEEIALTAKKHEIESIDNRVRGIELNADVNKLKWKSITVSPFGMNDEVQIVKDILALNVNSVTIPILCDVPSVNSNQVVIKAQSYNRAKRIMSLLPVEYQMILKPQVYISEGVVESSSLNPANKATFMASWKNILMDITGYMLTYENLDAIHIADSMKNLEGEFDKWRDIVTSLRVLNEGIQIVYETDSWEIGDIVINSNARFSSVLNNPMMELSDTISVKASFPLTPLLNMTSRNLADLIKRPNKIEGKSIVQQMEELSVRWKKNVFIGDVRIAPYDGMYSKPWSDVITGLTYNRTTQSNWLQAWHDAFNGQTWFKGFSAYSISEQDSPFNLIDDARNTLRILKLGGFGESIQLIDKRVTANEASLSVQSHEIKAKVSLDQYEGDINRFGERITSAESNIIQNANAIALTVSSETYVTGIKELDDRIKDSAQILLDISADNKITQSERINIKDRITGIIGSTPSDTQAMPTSATLDAGLKGSFYSVRKEALNVGVLVTDSVYENVATNYTALKTELDKYNPKVYNTTSVEVLTISSLLNWRNAWINYYESVNRLSEITSAFVKTELETIKTNHDTSLKVLDGKIEARVTTSQYTVDKEGIETRLSGAESSVVQSAIQIQSKVSQLHFDEAVSGIGNRLNVAETSITQTKDEIKSLATQQSVNDLTGRISTAESTIVQQAGLISSKVSQDDFNKLGNRLSNAETSITQTANEIKSLATQSSVDSLTGRIGVAETSITQTANSIKSLATQSSMNDLTGRVSSAESQIIQNAGLIQSKVSQSEFDGLKAGGRNLISGNPLNLKERISKDNWRYMDVTDVIMEVGETYTFSWKYDVIKSQIANLENDIDIHVGSGKKFIGLLASAPITAKKVTFVWTEEWSEEYGNAFAYKLSDWIMADEDSVIDYWNIQLEVGNLASDWQASPEDVKSQIDDVEDRVISAETSITQTAESIVSLATKTEMISGRVSTAESKIIQQADLISQTVTKDYFDDYKFNIVNLINNPATTGNSTGWTVSTAGTINVESKDFNGSAMNVLAVRSTGSSQVYSEYFDVDPTKSYEVSVWIKSEQPVPNTTHAYLGVNSLGSTAVETIASSTGVKGADSDNFYFWSVASSTKLNDWYKVTAYILPTGFDPAKAKNLGENATAHAGMKPSHTKFRIRWLNWANTNLTPRTMWVANPFVREVPSEMLGNNNERIIKAETSITQTSESIKLLATKSSVDTLTGKLTNAETSITQTADSIVSLASKTQMDNQTLSGKISSAESSISQQANLISSKVSTTDYNGNTVASMINQSSTTVSIQASKINLVGAVTVLSDISGNLGSITAGRIDLSEDIRVGAGIYLRGNGLTTGVYLDKAQIDSNDGVMSIYGLRSISIGPFTSFHGQLDLSKPNITWGNNKPVAVWG